jgi:hypothetical protein
VTVTENEFSGAFSTAFDAYAGPGPGPGPVPGDCAWPLDPACLTAEWDAFPPEVQGRAHALAATTLRRLSGYRVGGCPITVRPCIRGCLNSALLAERGWGPSQLADGSWVNSCGCQTDCSCTALCEVRLAAPVGPITWVKVDGVVVPPEDYRVDGDRLVWTGSGECPWPICQDLASDDTEVGTFAVRYLNAHAPDALAAYAAGVLAMEFAKACTGGKCRLPANVTSVSRQGVSYEMTAGSFPSGRTGIREIDAWLGLWNPEGMRQASTVWWPGKRDPRRVASR